MGQPLGLAAKVGIFVSVATLIVALLAVLFSAFRPELRHALHLRDIDAPATQKAPPPVVLPPPPVMVATARGGHSVAGNITQHDGNAVVGNSNEVGNTNNTYVNGAAGNVKERCLVMAQGLSALAQHRQDKLADVKPVRDQLAIWMRGNVGEYHAGYSKELLQLQRDLAQINLRDSKLDSDIEQESVAKEPNFPPWYLEDMAERLSYLATQIR